MARYAVRRRTGERKKEKNRSGGEGGGILTREPPAGCLVIRWTTSPSLHGSAQLYSMLACMSVRPFVCT